MTLKSNKDRTLENEVDNRWRSKGGSHSRKHTEPHVCPNCGGLGGFYTEHDDMEVCLECGGTGEIL